MFRVGFESKLHTYSVGFIWTSQSRITVSPAPCLWLPLFHPRHLTEQVSRVSKVGQFANVRRAGRRSKLFNLCKVWNCFISFRFVPLIFSCVMNLMKNSTFSTYSLQSSPVFNIITANTFFCSMLLNSYSVISLISSELSLHLRGDWSTRQSLSVSSRKPLFQHLCELWYSIQIWNY
jgi:hypothetical protein